MATSTYEEVVARVKQLQADGERLFERMRSDVRTLLETAPRPEIPRQLADAGKRAEAVVRRQTELARESGERLAGELRARRDQIAERLRERSRDIAERTTKLLGAAEADRVAELSREVTGLSLRVAELERKLTALGKKLKQQEAA